MNDFRPRGATCQHQNARAITTRAKFVRKIELLEKWADAGGAPDGVDWPHGPVALKEWTDSNYGLEAWSSPNVASPGGRYSDLRERFDAAVTKLVELGSGGSKASLSERYRNAKALNRALAAQVLTIRCQLRKQEGVLARTQDLLRIATEREAELTSELAKLRPFRPV
jgi:hypothetical protein